MNPARSWKLLLFGVLLLTSARVGSADYDPYAVPRGEFRQRVRVVALEPFEPLQDAPNPAAMRAGMETRLADALRKHGFEVLDSQHFEAQWRRFSEQLGGVYDPTTGRVDPEKHAIVREFTLRELATTLHVDAVLTSYIGNRELESYVSFEFGDRFGYGYYATLEEPLRLGDQPIPGDPGNKPQRVMGLSLEVQLRDISDAPLYGVACSIQWTRVYVARGYYDRPTSELHPQDRLDRVVEACTEDLAPQAE